MQAEVIKVMEVMVKMKFPCQVLYLKKFWSQGMRVQVMKEGVMKVMVKMKFRQSGMYCNCKHRGQWEGANENAGCEEGGGHEGHGEDVVK
jgi:hypothetical protein